jgi:hypothetical protein
VFVRFLRVFGLILLYMLVLAAILFPVILWAGEDVTLIVSATLVTLVLSVAALIPYLDWVTKRVFRFPGEGDPVSGAELRAAILAINQFDVPVVVEERKDRLVATWKYVEVRWWKFLAKAGLAKSYELHMKLDDAQHLVTLIDVTKSVSWGAGPTEVHLRGGFFRGVIWAYEIGKGWGIKDNFQLGKIYDYTFVPQEIKMPIMNSILRRGWDVRFGMW